MADIATDNTKVGGQVETDPPARMDRLPWSRWHWLVVFALGITWVLDGLEVTIVGAIATVVKDKRTLGLSGTEVGVAGGIYVAGNVVGALFFGYLTDRLGRKRLFTWTLLLYLLATVATAFSWSPMAFLSFRFLTGAGIGGEYSAVNSATEELNAARVRGTVELAINGSWWLGMAIGALASLVLLNPRIFTVDLGWRVAFGLGTALGLAVLAVRHLLPESPPSPSGCSGWMPSNAHWRTWRPRFRPKRPKLLPAPTGTGTRRRSVTPNSSSPATWQLHRVRKAWGLRPGREAGPPTGTPRPSRRRRPGGHRGGGCSPPRWVPKCTHGLPDRPGCRPRCECQSRGGTGADGAGGRRGASPSRRDGPL